LSERQCKPYRVRERREKEADQLMQIYSSRTERVEQNAVSKRKIYIEPRKKYKKGNQYIWQR